MSQERAGTPSSGSNTTRSSSVSSSDESGRGAASSSASGSTLNTNSSGGRGSSSSGSIPVTSALFLSRGLIEDVHVIQQREGGSSGSISSWPSSGEGSRHSEGDWRKAFEETGGGDRVTRGPGGIASFETPTLNFDMMEPVIYGLNAKQKAEGRVPYEIYVFDAIEHIVQVANWMESGHLSQDSIGILYRPGAHTTPILLTRNGREIIAINTDSVLFDVDDGDMLKDHLQQLSQYMAVYSLGVADVPSDLRRQYDNYSCAVFAMYDLIHMLETDFVECEGRPLVGFVLEESAILARSAGGVLYNLEALPAVFMAITQSIHGKEEGGVKVRRGLKQHLEARPQSRDRSTPTPTPAKGMEGAYETLGELIRCLEASGRRNDYAKTFNKRLYQLYSTYLDCEEKRDFSVLRAQARVSKPVSRLVCDAEGRWPTYEQLVPEGSYMFCGAGMLRISPIVVEEDLKAEEEVIRAVTPAPSSPLPHGVVNSALLRTPDRRASKGSGLAAAEAPTGADISPSTTLVKPHAYRTPPRKGPSEEGGGYVAAVADLHKGGERSPWRRVGKPEVTR